MVQEPVIQYKKLSDGQKMFTKYWSITGKKIKGTILVIHGLGETADYYDEFSLFASTHGFDMIVPELRGHGRTAGDILNHEYGGGNPGTDSLHKMADDISLLATEKKAKFPSLPVFLLGHSMGSVVAQLAVIRHGELFDGLLLTGIPSAENAGELLEILDDEISRRGPKAKCQDTFNVLFSGVNEPFEPVKTPLDWITSDDEMIRESLALPYTAVLFTNEFYHDFLTAQLEIQEKESLLNVPKQLPVFFLAGEKDVMAHNGKAAEEKQRLFRDLGLSNTQFKIYPGLRHSILREKSRDQVMDDLLHWIELRLKIRVCRTE
ncbi:MAG: alpha/beta fold hydrolase [Ethanoligenens sp.]